MKAAIEIVDPKNVVASITLTMTVEGWQQLRKAMDGQPYYGAAQQLRTAVDELVERVGRKINYSSETGSATERSGTDDTCPGEHQEVLDAIQSHNSGEDE